MAFHGTPGSRLERIFTNSALHDTGIRLIVVERQGYGVSEFDPRRRMLDWPNEVERLADALDIERFSVMGFSGGGPYAAACAYKLSERLFHTVLVSSPAPHTKPGLTDDMQPGNRMLFEQARTDYRTVAQQLATLLDSAESLYALFEEPAAAEDRQILSDPQFRNMYLKNLAESMRQGFLGMAYDMALLATPWGFEPEQLSGRVSVWYGENDVFVPPVMGHYLANAIPACQAFASPDQGHYPTSTQGERILRVLSET